MMYSFDGKSARAAGMVTGYDPNTGGFICAEDGGWVLYNYDGSNLIETAEMWSDDGTGDQVGYYPVQGDGMVLTLAAANAIAAQYQPIANIIIQNQLELIGLVVRSWSTERRGISPPFFLKEICHLRTCGDF